LDDSEVSGVDGDGDSEDDMGRGAAAPQMGAVFDVVEHQRGGVEMLDKELYGGEGGVRNADPNAKGVDEGGANAFGGKSVGVFEGRYDILCFGQ